MEKSENRKIIRVGSRASQLAVLQAEIAMAAIREVCPGAETRLVTMTTTGDRILDRPLERIGGKGLFVKELDLALREGRCDLTVHSLKDVPMETPPDLPLLAFLPREDCRDVLVLPPGKKELPPHPVIGTSSRRRILQAKRLFPDACFRGIRGNLATRLKKLDAGEYDALILAAAGLIRLGLSERISRYFEPEEILPAAGQGILAIQGRRETGWEFVSKTASGEAWAAATAERAFVRELEGGCSLPTAALARLQEDRLHLRGLYWEEETGRWLTGEMTGAPEEAAQLGRALARRLRSEVRELSGRVYLVGAGPGDAGLLTVRGRELLERADTVIYDALAGTALLSWAPPGARFIDVGKRSGRHSVPQPQINRILVEEGRRGGTVVRLKGGDPFVFGRGGEEAAALRAAGIPFEVVPGVSSAFAVAAYAGIPVTHRGLSSSVHVITGHRQEGAAEELDFAALARLGGTLCFLMGVSAAEEICRKLVEAGVSAETPAAFLQEGTLASAKTVLSTLGCLAEDGRRAGISAPAILVVGEVCRLPEICAWAKERPLSGLRILVTRPRERAGRLADFLRDQGAEVISLPTAQTVPLTDRERTVPFPVSLADYQWLVFTSAAGVDFFFRELQARRMDRRLLNGARFAVIGRATGRELEKNGYFADYMPEHFYGRELGEGLARKMEPGERALLLRAEMATVELPDALSRAGIAFEEVSLYRTVTPEPGPQEERVKEMLKEGRVDLVTFTSGSTVRGFLERFAPGEEEKEKFTAVCIGTETARTAREAGFTRILTSEEPSEESLAAAILSWAGAEQKRSWFGKFFRE